MSISSAAAGAKEKKSKRKSLLPSGAQERVNINILSVTAGSEVLRLVASLALDEEDIVDVEIVGKELSLATLSRGGRFTLRSVKAPDPTATARTQKAVSGGPPITLECTLQRRLAFASDKLDCSSGILTAASNGSPSILLTAARPNSPETLQTLLIATHYSLVLSEQRLQLPIPAGGRPDVIQLDAGHFAIACTAARGKQAGGSARRSLVHSMPCSIPVHSSLADLIGTKALTQSYLAVSDVSWKPDIPEDAAVSELLQNLQNKLGGQAVTGTDVKAAEIAFQEWHSANKGIDSAKLCGPAVRQVLSLAVGRARPTQVVASGIVNTIVSSGLAADQYIPAPGLTAASLAKGDWTSVLTCISHLKDIPETTLVEAFRASCRSAKAAPESVLRAIVKAPVTAAELRKALRAGLGTEELQLALHICKGWLQPSTEPMNGAAASSPGMDHVGLMLLLSIPD